MFGSLFSKAADLLGKPLLVVAFFPVIFAASGLLLTIAPERLDSLLQAWQQDDFSSRFTSALAILFALYILAFVLYGLREFVSNFVAYGRFWIFPRIIRNRRHFFIDWRSATARAAEHSYVLADATVWAEQGFPLGNRDIIRQPTDRVSPTIEAELIAVRLRLARVARRGRLREQLDAHAQRLIQRALLLLLEYFGSTTDNAATQREIHRFCALCERIAPGVNKVGWYRQAQLYLYQDVVDAERALQQFPPLQFVQPTMLGNVLGWAGVYTLERYGIELAALFPRLLKVVDKDYAARIDEQRQYHEFGVMMNVLCVVNAVVTFTTGIWNSSYYACASGFPWSRRAVPLLVECMRDELSFVLWASAWFALGLAFYFVAVSTGRTCATLVTSAVDLFRLDLLTQLKITPGTPADERRAWERLNQAATAPTSIAEETDSAPPPPPGGAA